MIILGYRLNRVFHFRICLPSYADDYYRGNSMDAKQLIELLIRKAQKEISAATIIFLANVQGMTSNTNDYIGHSIITEFLTMNEYNELLSSLQDFGFYVLTYFDSNDFFQDYLNGKFQTKKIVIFEGTQKGIGRARDALLPAFCDLENLIHTGPNAYVNSICTNKYHWTRLLNVHAVCVPNSWRYFKGMWLYNFKPVENKTLIAKPCYECASIGVHKQSVAEYSAGYEIYLKQMSERYNQPLIVQEFISGYEVEVPVIIHRGIPYVLPPVVLCKAGNAVMGDSFLDFDDIYEDNYQFCLLESINSAWCSNIKKQVLKVVELLELERYVRIDFRIALDGTSYVTDINSYPHIVSHSSFAYAFNQIGINEHNILPCLIGNVLTD